MSFLNLAPFYLKKVFVCMVLSRNITFWTCAIHAGRSLWCDHMSGQKKGFVKWFHNMVLDLFILEGQALLKHSLDSSGLKCV